MHALDCFQGQESEVRVDPEAARELVDALGADMMLVSSELEKLLLYAQGALVSHWAMLRPWFLAPSSAHSTTHRRHQRHDVCAPWHCCRDCLIVQTPRGRGHRPPLHARRTFARCWLFWRKTFATRAPSGRHCGRAFACRLCRRRSHPPGAPVQEPPRLTRALRLVARADLELRSSPPDKRLVLERLVYDLASEPKLLPPRGHRHSCPSRVRFAKQQRKGPVACAPFPNSNSASGGRSVCAAFLQPWGVLLVFMLDVVCQPVTQKIQQLHVQPSFAALETDDESSTCLHRSPCRARC